MLLLHAIISHYGQWANHLRMHDCNNAASTIHYVPIGLDSNSAQSITADNLLKGSTERKSINGLLSAIKRSAVDQYNAYK